MKPKNNWATLCSGCTAGALLLMASPTFADETVGLWEFKQNQGAIVDTSTNNNNLKKNGHLGRWVSEYSSNNVSSFKRASGASLFKDAINFLGKRENQVVMGPDVTTRRFDPGLQSFLY